MEHLKDYCLDVCVIDGLQTYVIDSAKYGVLIKDNELLNYLKKTDKDILSYIELTREIGIDKIYLAFAPFCAMPCSLKARHITANSSSLVVIIPASPKAPKFLVGKNEKQPVSPRDPAFFPLNSAPTA